MIKRFSLVLLALCVCAPGALAQEGDCPPGELEPWVDAANRVLFDYDSALETVADLQTVANLQALRRTIEDVERPECADAAYEAVLGTLNLTADSIVASLLEDDELAEELWFEAEAQRAEANEALADLIAVLERGPISEPPAALTITSPTEGEQVPSQIQVQGDYDPASIGDNVLWLFVMAPNNKFYLQYSCTDEFSVAEMRGLGSWRATAHLGEEGGNQGEEYMIILMMFGPEANETLATQAMEWCEAGDFPGMTPQEVEGLGGEYLSTVNVIRE